MTRKLFSFFCIPVLLGLYTAILNVTTSGSITTVSAAAFGNLTDRDALLEFKSKMVHDPQAVFSSWNDSYHHCQWQGVRCGRKHQRVTILDLNSKGLVGPLSPAVGNLSFLRALDLSNNTFQGKIPDEVGRLLRLKILILGNNSFVGEVPGNLSHCSKLEYLWLAGNKLVGGIPAELVFLSNLKELVIHWNYLTGKLPKFIGNLTSLVSISAAGNAFEGEVPDTFSQLINLQSLGLGTNNLSGTFSTSIQNLSSLQILSLSENKFHGSLPSDLGLSLPSLQNIQLRGNQFSGLIPLSITNSSNLLKIDFGQNNFSGKLSVNFGVLEALLVISVSFNRLGSGEPDEFNFLDSLTNCTSLYAVDLVSNQFEGMLPDSVANLSTELIYLGVGRNLISGLIPSGISRLINLNTLGMEINQLTGSIPSDFGKLNRLQRVSLAYNQLSGRVPSSVGNLTLLLELDLQSNQLQGSIPTSIGGCQQLLVLHLSQNNLNGSVPKELFMIRSLSISLDLSKNYLVGHLPPEIGSLERLGQLVLSENEFSGEIPTSLATCTSLERLSLQHNFFQGSIPPSLSSLRGIRVLDVSHNNLSGQIPEFLAAFSLLMLNLSFNDFEGEVPTKGPFSNVTALSVDGNRKLCGGISDLHLPKCNFHKSKNGKLPLWALLTLVACSLLGVNALATAMFCWLRKKRNRSDSGLLLKEPLPKVSYQMLLKATDGFSSANLIGTGGFGSVYKGVLNQDKVVAIKVLNLQVQGASRSFMTECEALRNIRHRNLVKIITSCSSVDFQGHDFKALVYEFMPNGSLEAWLHPDPENDSQENEPRHLNLLQRINIAIDVAAALDYLHHHSHKPIIHCDLKTSNILLDGEMTAHVGDFGLARFYPELSNFSQSSSIALPGTIGYAAPEYGLGSEASIYGDIFSYGIMLLEMLTGKRPTNSMFNGDLNLHKFARMALPGQVLEILDPVLLSATEANEKQYMISNKTGGNSICSSSSNQVRAVEETVIYLINIGVSCSMESPQDRMQISKVITELNALRKTLQETTLQ